MKNKKRLIAASTGLSDPGRIRPNNEDSYLIREDLGLFVLADGMGGAAAGEVASQIFVKTAEEVFLSGHMKGAKYPELIKEAFQKAHLRIKEDTQRYPEHHGMGCTGEILAFEGAEYHLGHLGDSRTYLFYQEGLKQLTKDHTLVQEQVDMGLISKEEARTHKLRHVLSRAVGYEEHLQIDLLDGQLKPGSLFLMCSDGLTDELSDDEIQKILSQGSGLENLAARLVNEAKEKGGRDNITVILVRISEFPQSDSQEGIRGILARMLGR